TVLETHSKKFSEDCPFSNCPLVSRTERIRKGDWNMKLVDSIIAELEREAETTRRVLQRVPDEKLNWKPHPKSMSLGQLANHIATTPGGVATIVTRNEFEAPDFNNLQSP